MRAVLLFGGGLAALFLLLIASLCFGEAQVSFKVVFEALLHRQDILSHHVIWDMRMPRAILGLFSGAGLAVAGVLLQTVTKNPLASTDTLGINAGAYFMVVAGTIYFPSLLHQAPFLFAAAGGGLAAMCAYVLGGGRSSSPIRLALAGMIVAMVVGSFTSALHIFHATETQSLFLWGSGSLAQLDWKGVAYAWPGVGAVMIIAFLMSKQFDVLNLDPSTAASLGQKVDLARFAGLALAVLVASVVVSVVGPIGFVGLVAPHLVRLSGVRKHSWLIPATALWGAILLTLADVLTRMVRSSIGEMPVGAMMAIIGAPCLIWLILRRMKGISGSYSSSSISIGTIRGRIRFPVVAFIMLCLVVSIILISMTMGGTRIPLSQLFIGLIGSDKAESYSFLLHLRLPRTLVAAGAGIALSVSGVLIQASVRNPLADSSILGVSSGAGFGALLVLIAWPQVSIVFLPIAAMGGAIIAAAVIFLFAWRKSLNPSVLILLGIAASAIGSAGIQALIVLGPLWGSSSYIWLTGSTYSRTWDQFLMICIFLAVLLPVAWWLGRRFDLLAFSDDSAIGFGLSVRKTRFAAMTVGVLLSAGAVAVVGTVGFLGLIVPHMIRSLIGHNTRQSIVLSSLLGALLLVLADAIGRTILAPVEIPSGLFITLIGAPYFLFLMFRSHNRKL
ncbi:iron ABC transporter permease [Paenibacillus arenilitoris]|uniref:Iron ABC transporter permease n=1 Tax=Paenibacillus arenilitoris TaxID=2772299 RepID=A0A927CF86_9BACL|nr:iron ABC transporter permease [Paenibacillus arenilitoris]MBD2866984.1 iron ABC transporter permease [Paenibacillus arenilitoris]